MNVIKMEEFRNIMAYLAMSEYYDNQSAYAGEEEVHSALLLSWKSRIPNYYVPYTETFDGFWFVNPDGKFVLTDHGVDEAKRIALENAWVRATEARISDVPKIIARAAMTKEDGDAIIESLKLSLSVRGKAFKESFNHWPNTLIG